MSAKRGAGRQRGAASTAGTGYWSACYWSAVIACYVFGVMLRTTGLQFGTDGLEDPLVGRKDWREWREFPKQKYRPSQDAPELVFGDKASQVMVFVRRCKDQNVAELPMNSQFRSTFEAYRPHYAMSTYAAAVPWMFVTRGRRIQ